MEQVSNNPAGIARITQAIKNGKVVIFPTDTVYGIGCNPYDQKAVNRIYRVKKRDEVKPLPVLGYSKQVLENIVKFDEITDRIADKFWPGQLTIVLPLKDDKLKQISGGSATLAVRVPNNKCILSFLKECKLIVGTSANISGKKPFTDPQNLQNEAPDCDLFLNGGIIQSSGESTIIEIKNGNIKILRNGGVTETDLVREL